MIDKEKQLLFKDLCARLPYGVKCRQFKSNTQVCTLTFDLLNKLENLEPYLRPMSSMTKEEEAQIQKFIDIVTNENYGDGYSPSAWDAMNDFVQYCDSRHLDHRGLIPMGIALEAPKGMYK